MYLEYVKNLNASSEVISWVNTTLSAYIKKDTTPSQSEIEHVLDYLCSNEGPKKLIRMSYEQAKEKASAWLKTQKKKGMDIKESKEDTETIYKFDDGSRIAKLIGLPAFKREGFLMSSCVASWHGKSDRFVYSYRDKENNPHATFEVVNNGKDIQQIKGKGNGPIHPKYIHPILKFLESINFKVRDVEMKNLGYWKLPNKVKEMILEATGKTLPEIELGNTIYQFVG